MAIPKRKLILRKGNLTIGKWIQLSRDMGDEAESKRSRAWVDIMLETTNYTEDELLAVAMDEMDEMNDIVKAAQEADKEKAVPPESAAA